MLRLISLLCLWAVLPVSPAAGAGAAPNAADNSDGHKYASAMRVPFGPGEVLT